MAKKKKPANRSLIENSSNRVNLLMDPSPKMDLGPRVRNLQAILAANSGTNGHHNSNGRSLSTSQQLIHAMKDMVNNAMLTRTAFAQWFLDQLHDINKECGYPETISAEAYKTMYEREGIAARVVSIFPSECFAVSPEVYETEDMDDETEFEAQYKALDNRLKLVDKMFRLDEVSGIGHYGVLYMGTADGKNPAEPIDGFEDNLKALLDKKKKPKEKKEEEVPEESSSSEGDDETEPVTNLATVPSGDFGLEAVTDLNNPFGSRGSGKTVKGKVSNDVLFCIPLDESLAQIVQTETDPHNWRYGKPTYYNITFHDPSQAEAALNPLPSGQTKVHWTRVVHVADNCKSSDVWGQPRQKSVWNRLVDVRKLMGGAGEMFWKGGFPGMAFEVPTELYDQVELDREDLAKEADLYMNTLKRYLSLSGVSAKMLTQEVADPQNHFDIQITAICISKEVPKRIFMGTEEAKLASIEDATAWLNRVKRRQNGHLTSNLVCPIVDWFIVTGNLPEVEDYHVNWPDLHKNSDADKAAVAAQLTSAIVQYVTSGADSLFPPLEFLTLILGIDREVAIAVLQAAEDRINEMQGQLEEEQAAQDELDQQQMDQQAQLHGQLVDGLTEGAKQGGVNIPSSALPEAQQAGQLASGRTAQLAGPTKSNLPVSRNPFSFNSGVSKDRQLWLQSLAQLAVNNLILNSGEPIQKEPEPAPSVDSQPHLALLSELAMKSFLSRELTANTEAPPLLPQETKVTVNMPEQVAPHIEVQVNVPEQKEQPAPVVNVQVPEQVIPVVNVSVPEQVTPVVNVNVPEQPKPEVNVDVHVPEQKKEVFDVVAERDPETGAIVKWKNVKRGDK